MNIFHNINRVLRICIWGILTLCGGTIFIVQAISLFRGEPNPGAIFLLVIACFTALCCWRIVRIVRKKTWGEKRHLRAKERQQAATLLSKAKACPGCGERLTLCERHDGPAPKLYVPMKSKAAELYCVPCDRKYPAEGEYAMAAPEKREAPAGAGVCYGVEAGAFRRIYIYTGVFLLAGVLLLYVGLRAVIQGISGLLNIWALLMGIAFLFLSGKYIAMRRPLKALRYELLEDGLVCHERQGKQLFLWEDFRMADIRENGAFGQAMYLFDLRQQHLVIDAGIENHIALGEAILEKIHGIARVEPA